MEPSPLGSRDDDDPQGSGGIASDCTTPTVYAQSSKRSSREAAVYADLPIQPPVPGETTTQSTDVPTEPECVEEPDPRRENRSPRLSRRESGDSPPEAPEVIKNQQSATVNVLFI